MSYPTSALLTDLDVVNELLAAVGQAPVTSIDRDTNDYPTNPDVAMALESFFQTSREVQSEGWTFNREFCYPMTPNSDGEIHYPNNVLQLDLSQEYVVNRNRDAVKRDGKLYDRTAHSFYWNDDKVYVDVLWYFPWTDLPIPVQQYVLCKAAALFSQRVVGDPNQYQQLMEKAMECRTYALEYECNQGDYTFFGHPSGENYYVSYQPYKALYR